MKNRDFLKQVLYEKIDSLTDEELYDIASDHLLYGKMCKHCESFFGACSDEEEIELECKERFNAWLEMINSQKDFKVAKKEAEAFEFAKLAEYLDGRALIVYDTQNEMYFGLGQCRGWTENFESMTFDNIIYQFKKFVIVKMKE